ncbi:MarR family winged helix-turn-helix transcriptional regulator [Puia dinghuensis]|nr:MarR family transcriptional regulator [Puia dinghuensis]
MSTINPSLKMLMNLTRAQAVVSRRLDRLSMHGIGFTDFVILYLLSQATGERMRRIDLAEKIGITASGVTRILIPMEKTGLVNRESTERDARVSFVVLTEAGRRIFEEAKTTANLIAKEIIPVGKIKNLQTLSELLDELAGPGF